MSNNISKEDYEKLMQYRRLKARVNLIDYCTLVHVDYEPKPVHYLIADRMEQAYKGNIPRLMINTPPRIGKSELASKLAPTWYMGANPGKSVVLATYSGSLAEDFGSDSRNYVQHQEYNKIFPTAEISKQSQAKVGWSVEHTLKDRIYRGTYINTSVGGSLTGKGGNVLTIDDPVKDRQEANSKVTQENVWNFYTSTFASRGNDRGRDEVTPIIVIMTRWSEGDLAGRLLEKEQSALAQEQFKHLAEGWEVLSLPAIAEEDEEYYIYNKDYQERLGDTHFRRKKGQTLDPDLYPIQKLRQLEFQSPQDFASLYQQRPTIEGGLIFKKEWFREYRKYQKINKLMTIHSYDTGSTEKDSADPTSMSKLVFDGVNIYLEDEINQRMSFPDIKQTILDKAREDKPDFILIESASSGIDLIADLKNTFLPIVPIKTGGDSKYIRAVSTSPFIQSGKFHIRQDIPNKEAILKEFRDFPNGRHDDRVDSVGQGIRFIQDLMVSSYYFSAISEKNMFLPFTPPESWPVIRIINIPSNNEPFCVLWATIARPQEKIYEVYQLKKNQIVIFEELLGYRDDNGIDVPIKASIEEILEAVYETEKAYGIESQFTFINSDNSTEDPRQHGLFNIFVKNRIFPYSLKINHKIMAPLLYDELGNSESPLIITQNCRKTWKKLPFYRADSNYGRVFDNSQEFNLLNTLMMAVSPSVKGHYKDFTEPTKPNPDRIMYDHIFGVSTEPESGSGIT